MRIVIVIVTCGLAFQTVPALAHHSLSAEYDIKKPVTVQGSVLRVQWTNPHAHVFLTVIDGSGRKVTWEFELASPNSLMRAGWDRFSLRQGDQVTVKGFRSKDGANLANASSIVLPDGKPVLSGASSADGLP